ncbi:Piercer of microtubule wall 2 protein [Vulpes lagopus]
MDSNPPRPRRAPVSPGKEGGSPGPSAPPLPWHIARVSEQGSRAARPPDPTPLGSAQARGAADSRSETSLARAPARSRRLLRPRSSPSSSKRSLTEDPAPASARPLSCGCRTVPDRRPRLLSRASNPPRAVPERAAPPPTDCVDCRGGGGHSCEHSDASLKNNNLLAGVCSREAAGGGGRRGAAAHAGTRSPARSSGPAPEEARTTTPKDERSPPRLGCRKLGGATAIPTTSGPRPRSCSAAGCYGDGLLLPLQRIRGFTSEAALWIRRISQYLLIQRTVDILFAALIGCSKNPARSLVLPTAAGKDCVYGKNKEDTEDDRDKKCASASDSGTEMKPEQLPPCVNPGNPVFSCMLDPKTLQTATSLSKPKMIMYKTNSSNYGEFLPMPQFFPCNYTPREQVFSSHIRATGFYQNNSLNAAPDRTRTLDFPNLQHTL